MISRAHQPSASRLMGDSAARSPRRRVGAVSASVALLAILVGCAPPSPSATSAGDAPAVAATECGELIDGDVVRATRLASEEIPEEIVDHALAICGADPSFTWAGALQAAYDEAESSATPTPTIPDGGRLQETFSITDRQGYTFDLGVTTAIYNVASDPSTQPPGFTAATRSVSIEMTLTNTTPERELSFEPVSGLTSPYNLPTFMFSAEFNAGNPVCTIALEKDGPCSWVLGFGRMESGTTVSPGYEYALTAWSGMPNGGEESEILPRIPEESWPEIQAALSEPDGFSIDYSAADPHRFKSVCEPSDSQFSSLDALLPTIVSTIPC